MKETLTLTLRLDAEVAGRRFGEQVLVQDEVIQGTDKAVMLVKAFDEVGSRLWKRLQAFKQALAENPGKEPPLSAWD